MRFLTICGKVFKKDFWKIILIALIFGSCTTKPIEVVNEYSIRLGDNNKIISFKFQYGNVSDTTFLKKIIPKFSEDDIYYRNSKYYDSLIVSKYALPGGDIRIYKHKYLGPVFCTNNGVADFECKLISSNYFDSIQVKSLVKICKEIDSLNLECVK